MSNKTLREAATQAALCWLLAPEKAESTKRLVEESLAAVLAGNARLLVRKETALAVLATQLARRFGEDAPTSVYDSDSWQGFLAFWAAHFVDWHEVANGLLRSHAFECVPAEAHDAA